MDVLITGAAGFIGRNLARRLAAAGHQLTCVDDLSVPPTGLAPPRLVRRDVRALTAADLECAETIVHLAARKNVPDSFHDHTQLLHNIAVDYHLLHTFTAARRPRRLLLASSCEVYGARPEPCAEHLPPAPRSPYAVGKVTTELLAAIYRELNPDREICSLRFHNIYGPDEGPDAIVPAFIDAVAAGQPITIEGDGRQARDMTHIEDLTTMLHTILADPHPIPKALNLGSGTATAVNGIADLIREAAGTQTAIVHVPGRPNEIPAFVADLTTYIERYGPVPTRPLADGIGAAFRERTGTALARR